MQINKKGNVETKRIYSRFTHQVHNFITSEFIPDYEKEIKMSIVDISRRIFNMKNMEFNDYVIYKDINKIGDIMPDPNILQEYVDNNVVTLRNVDGDPIRKVSLRKPRSFIEYGPNGQQREIFEIDFEPEYVKVNNNGCLFNWSQDKDETLIQYLTITGDLISSGASLKSMCCNFIKYCQDQLLLFVNRGLLLTVANIDKDTFMLNTNGFVSNNEFFLCDITLGNVYYKLYRMEHKMIPKTLCLLNIFDKINSVYNRDYYGFTVFLPDIYKYDKEIAGFKIDYYNKTLSDGFFQIPFITDTRDILVLTTVFFRGLYFIFYKYKKNNVGVLYEQSAIVRSYLLPNGYKIIENIDDDSFSVTTANKTYDETISNINRMILYFNLNECDNYSTYCDKLSVLMRKKVITSIIPYNVLKSLLFHFCKTRLNELSLNRIWFEHHKLNYGVCESEYTLKKNNVELDFKHFYDIKDYKIRKELLEITHNFHEIIQLDRKHQLNTDKLFELLTDDFKQVYPNIDLSSFKEQFNCHLRVYYKMYDVTADKNDRRFYYRKLYIMDHEYDNSVLRRYAAYLNMFRTHYKNVCGDVIYSPYGNMKLTKCLYNIYKTIYLSLIDIKSIQCTCKGKCTKYINIVPTFMEQDTNILYYNSCLRTVFSSLKRHCMFVVQPDYYEVLKFRDYFRREFGRIKHKLKKITYDYAKWFDHLNAKKQMDIIRIQDNLNTGRIRLPSKVKHDMFTKIEKQSLIDKTRAIMAIRTIIKNITGPIDWMIENDFAQGFEFYCGKKNVDDYNYYFQGLQSDGYIDAYEGDGSAFDVTQHIFIKFIDDEIYKFYLEDIDSLIFNKLVEVGDVTYDISFNITKSKVLSYLRTPIKELVAKVNYNRDFINVEVVGTVFSGSTSTTSMNTIRNYFLNKFTTRLFMQIKFNTKGDDFMAFFKNIEFDLIKKVYNAYWVDKDHMFDKDDFGLGVIMKKLIKRTIYNIHFCSNFIVSDRSNFMFVREIDRLLKFGSYSRKAVHYTQSEFKQYLYDLAIALKASNLHDKPFFRVYYNAYMRQADLIQAEPVRIKDGAVKIHLTNDNDKYEQYNLANGEYRDYYYSRIFHDNSIEIAEEYFFDAIQKQYGLNANDENDLDYFLTYYAEKKGVYCPIYNQNIEKIFN